MMTETNRSIFAKKECKKDTGVEWSKHYCNNDCNSCDYGKDFKNQIIKK
ncbi:hypothetical protein [Clostridium estertheticum]|nr:hypothetical protein [Clostridium estertheticum]MBZ9615309.1 hypothetical protein [Clostridium estertheticum subsp. laramiense]WAG75198.1 hypothetical protein LL032_07035 [Clostridium estertheticum]